MHCETAHEQDYKSIIMDLTSFARSHQGDIFVLINREIVNMKKIYSNDFKVCTLVKGVFRNHVRLWD